MSEGWNADMFAEAERVPVWTRRRVGQFSSLAADADSPRFSAWDSPAPPPPAAAAAPEPDPQIARNQAIETDAFARGFQEGYAAASATIAGAEQDTQAAFGRLADALEALRPAPPADLARMIATTVSRLVEQIVGEVAIDGEHLARRIETVTALIEEDGSAKRLRLNPADIARLEGIATPLPLLADPTLAEGTIVAEGPAGWIEDGPAIRMERLRQALDAMAVTR